MHSMENISVAQTVASVAIPFAVFQHPSIRRFSLVSSAPRFILFPEHYEMLGDGYRFVGITDQCVRSFTSCICKNGNKIFFI